MKSNNLNKRDILITVGMLIGILPFCIWPVTVASDLHVPQKALVTAVMGMFWGLTLAIVVVWTALLKSQSLKLSTRAFLFCLILSGLYESTASIVLRIWLQSYHGHAPDAIAAKLVVGIGLVDEIGRTLSIITFVLVSMIVYFTIRRPLEGKRWW